MFLQASVILSTGAGGSPSVHAGMPAPQTRPPLVPDPPQTRPPHLGADPPWEADASIRSMSGWYASYWNAFL